MKLTLRDFFWLVLVSACVFAWWRESRLRTELQIRCNRTDQAILDLTKLTNLTIEERNGEFVFAKPANPFPVTVCPKCARRANGATGEGLLVVDDAITQAQIVDAAGDKVFGWRHTGVCGTCRTRFACVVMPEDAPGYMRWLPLDE